MSHEKSPRRRMLEIAIAAGTLAVIFAWSEGLFSRKVGPENSTPEGGVSYSGAVATVESRTIALRDEIPGIVRPSIEAVLSSRLVATVEEIRVREGDRVKAGEILAVLSAPELAAQAGAATQERISAEHALRQALIDAARHDTLHKAGAVSRAEWELASTARARAEAGLGRALEAEAAARATTALLRIRAPFAGVVLARHKDPGDLAAPGTPILHVADDRLFQLEVSVPERSAGRLRAGDSALVIFEGADEISARIARVIPVADPLSRTVTVQIDLPSHASARAGAFGRFLNASDSRRGVVAPEKAIVTRGEVSLARVVREDGRLETRYVRLGRILEDGTREILSGLEPGERVALEAPRP